MQRTCTTFMRSMCQKNLEGVKLFTNEFGSKHNVPRDEEWLKKWMVSKYKNNPRKIKRHKDKLQEMLNGNFMYSIIVIKNPYSWYYSIKAFRGAGFNFKKEYKKYNRLYGVYKDFHLSNKKKYGNFYSKSYIVKYENLLRDPNVIMKSIADKFELKLLHLPVILPIKVEQSVKFTDKRKKFYLSAGSFGLNKKQIDTINNILDWELMEFYGYKKL